MNAPPHIIAYAPCAAYVLPGTCRPRRLAALQTACERMDGKLLASKEHLRARQSDTGKMFSRTLINTWLTCVPSVCDPSSLGWVEFVSSADPSQAAYAKIVEAFEPVDHCKVADRTVLARRACHVVGDRSGGGCRNVHAVGTSCSSMTIN